MSEPGDREFPEGAEAGATDIGDRQRGSGARRVPTSSGLHPGARWARYVVRTQIGQGGMGTVFAAEDPTLGRKVALKLLRYEDPAQVERFLQEARTQAQVEHENVCKVYEVGEVRGRPYIAMQFLEGEPLQKAAQSMTLEEKVATMRQVCEGVHAAHRLGLIHRDIKPGNVMVERQEGSRPKAFVCDFGLAREVGSQGMTMTGLALGTPEYMAPEQAFGDTAKLDRRTDVYGLGATLYEILCGRRPYEGERSAEILAQLLESDPKPLLALQPDLPVDLQTIVMKCLERAPERRYDSARALAEDLGRFLDGEPIEARPATLSYRLAKKIRKNRVASLVLTASAAVLLVVGGWALRSELRSRHRTELAQRYGLIAKEIEGVMRYGHLLPLHDTRREGAAVRRRLARMRMEMQAEDDEAATGAIRYALGRGHLALQEYEVARQELEEAWRLGYRGPDVAYALAQAVGELYRIAAADLRAVEDSGLRAEQQGEVTRRYLDPLRAYLAAARGLQTEAPEYIEGLVAFYDRRFDDAIAKADQTLRQLPWFYEAAKLEGDVHETLATEAQDRGEYELAVAEHVRAGEAYAAGIETARSDAALYSADCSRRRALIEIAQARGELDRRAYGEAIEACQAALKANPDDHQGQIATSDLYWRLAEQESAAGIDPSDALARNLAAAQEAVRLRPADARAHHALGIAFTLAAEHALDQGRDPVADLDRADADLREAIRLDPTLAWSFNALGWARVRRAEWELASGEDPRPTVALARDVLEAGFRRAPGFYKTMKNLAAALRIQLEYEVERGIDPQETLSRARDALGRARSINAESSVVFEIEGEVELLAARWRAADRAPVAEELARARRALGEALRINPNMAEAERALAEASRLEAQWAIAAGGDPAAAFTAARRSIARSLTMNDRSPETLVEAARIEIDQAEFDVSRGRSGANGLRDALRTLQRALALRPGDRAARQQLTRLQRGA